MPTSPGVGGSRIDAVGDGRTEEARAGASQHCRGMICSTVGAAGLRELADEATSASRLAPAGRPLRILLEHLRLEPREQRKPRFGRTARSVVRTLRHRASARSPAAQLSAPGGARHRSRPTERSLRGLQLPRRCEACGNSEVEPLSSAQASKSGDAPRWPSKIRDEVPIRPPTRARPQGNRCSPARRRRRRSTGRSG
jgi:hypothetical protein